MTGTQGAPDPADRTDVRNYITVADAALQLRVSRRTIYNWMHGGKLPYKRQPGGRRLIFKQDLLDWRQSPLDFTLTLRPGPGPGPGPGSGSGAPGA